MNKSQQTQTTYLPNNVPSSLWRKIIDAASDYEMHLQSGFYSTPEVFASNYSDIPSEVLSAELHRLRDELESDKTLDSSAPNQIQRYKTLELISTGGMGEIYRGFDHQCQRPVAIKVIRRELQGDVQARGRFHAEAALTASMEHPGVIPIYGQGVDSQGRDFYAMRLISGGNSGTFALSIRQFHERSFSSTLEQSRLLRDLIRCLVDVADTVAYAHHQNIVHRDLKPSNILIGPYGETLIADWGLARRIDQSHSIYDQTSDRSDTSNSSPGDTATPGVGTPGYAAPDASAGSPQRSLRSADIYSLGAILVCILNNQPPITGTAVASKLNGIPSIGGLIAIAQKAIAPDWQQRYGNVEDFRSDLLLWIAGEPVSAMPENWIQQATRWPGRYPRAATGLATAVACTLLAGSVFLANQSRQNQIVVAQAKNLQIALDESSSLLKQTQKANLIAESRRVEAVKNRNLAEKRESLAFDGLLKFQNLLATNQQIFQSPQFVKLNETLSNQSRETFKAILDDLKQDLRPSPESVSRLEYMTRRVATSDANLGKHNQASDVIDQACLWMKEQLEDADQPSESAESTLTALRLNYGRLRALQGSLELRQGKFTESQPKFQAVVEIIEPLLQQAVLDPQDSHQARIVLMDAWSGLSMYQAYHGDPNQAKRLQQNAMDWIGAEPPRNTDEALTRMQIHGNMAILHQKAGESDEALKQLALAAKDIEDAFGMVDENPAGFATEDSSILPTIELITNRARVAHQRAQIMIANQKAPDAIPVLTQLLTKESDSLRLAPFNSTLVDLYENTATSLLVLLQSTGNHQRAKLLSDDWTVMAETLTALPATTHAHWNLLINAHHCAGHMYEQLEQYESAIEKYDIGTRICNQAIEKDMTTALILYHKMDLLSHLFQLYARNTPIDQIETYYEQSAQAATQLTSLIPDPNIDYKIVRHRLQQGIDLMRSNGAQEIADRWQEQLSSKKLLP